MLPTGFLDAYGKAMLEYCNVEKYGHKTIAVDRLVCQGVLSHVIKEK